ncbi:ATP-dependent sacrificial sulfur transferase LarE [Desulfobacula toluolica]|uniref:Conserved uncharacterized protein n=1 Tax=Desulfobacula toluolica (strain DSM 7467 / Tol2) TaxID=651182 RepID=K0NFR5_DESTT|nr:ATP-dependent sacrificial sulfur transferase LarE [Desulfobacula toluolica]CCK79790.1 conserved uncharacterized protein [Desulfobacula toluolica Tol2]
MQNKIKKIEKRLKRLSAFVVAFSGGVDSTFLLALAKKIAPQKLLAITVSSQFVPEREIDFAKQIARSIGVEHICIDVDILENKDVVCNPVDRCYYCKKQMFSLIKKMAEKQSIEFLLHGVNQDDLKEFRPGLKAAGELGFLSPLADAKLTKSDIRLFSKHMGLETWDKPSQSCLATRIPYHKPIKDRHLIMVDKAEAFLQNLGFAQVRVRYNGKSASIEVEPDLIDRISNVLIRQKISKKFRAIGFKQANIDINAYMPGKTDYEMFNGQIGSDIYL